MQGERLNVDSSVTRKQCGQIDHIVFCNASERRVIPDLLSSRKTCPEETIYQLGTLDEHVSAEDLLNLVTEFIDEFKSKFGDH